MQRKFQKYIRECTSEKWFKMIYKMIKMKCTSAYEMLVRGNIWGANGIYLTAFALYSIARAIENIAFASYYYSFTSLLANLLQISAALIFAVCSLDVFLRQKDNIKILIFVIGIWILIVTYVSKAFQLAWMFLFILASNDKNTKCLAKIALIVAACSIGAAFIADSLDITGESVWFRNQGRYSLGFIHPNVLGKELLTVVISLLAIKVKKMRLRDYLLVGLIAISILVITKSRTSFIGAVIAITLFTALDRNSGMPISRNIGLCISIICLVVAVISVCGVLLYSPSNLILVNLDEMLSGRLSLPHELVIHAPLSLFGFDLSTSSQYVEHQYVSALQGTVPVDNSYAHLFIVFGPLSLVIYLISVCFTVFNSYRKKLNSVEVVGLFICFLIGISEVYSLDIAFNYFVSTESHLLEKTASQSDC